MANRIQKGDDSRKNWPFINQGLSDIDLLKRRASVLEQQLADLRGLLSVSNGLHPFKIYQLPRSFRVVEDTGNGYPVKTVDDWRKFRVRNGLVGIEIPGPVTGTDEVEYPYSAEIPIKLPNNDPVPEITVPENVGQYWFWIEVSDGAFEIKHGADPTEEGWNDFPENPDGLFLVIGWVNTVIKGAQKMAIVQQIQTTHIANGPEVDTCAGKLVMPGAYKKF